jgi:hypothetical protein
MAFAYTVIKRFHGGALTATPLALLALAAALPEPPPIGRTHCE